MEKEASSAMLLDLAATSAACIVANIVTHPLEVLKVRQQSYQGGTSVPGMFALSRRMAQKEGFFAFYRGLGAGLYRAVISGGGRLAIYNQLKLLVGSDATTQGGVGLLAVLGMISGGTAAVAAAPLDLIRTRQQAMKGNHHQSILEISMNIIRNEGGVFALWAGSSATFLRQAAFTAAQLASYDKAKDAASAILKTPADSASTCIMAAAFSGAFTTFACAPIEMVKTQMQMCRRAEDRRAAAIVRSIFAAHGVRGFWIGSVPLYVKFGPHTALVLLGTEMFRQLLGVPTG